MDDKILVIEPGKVTKTEDGTRLSYIIKADGKEEELYYSVDDKYAPYLCDGRCDVALVTLFPFAMRFHYDIECKGLVSKKLLYNLSYHVIPMLYNDNRSFAKEIKIKAEHTDAEYYTEANGIATGISCGVDSLYTLYEYSRDDVPEEYRITHLTYFQNGAHHGQIGKYDGDLQEKIFDGQLAHTERFCKEFGYELIVIRSNLEAFIMSFFDFFEFSLTHTYRNLAFAMLLPGLIKKYYYASASLHPLFASKCDLNEDVAYYEKLVIPLLCTEYFQGYSANKYVTRLDKVRAIADFPQAYDWLLVCLNGIDKNCGECLKCRRTLAELDAIGKLELFKNCFDLEKYGRIKQEIVYRTCTKTIQNEDDFYIEAYNWAKENNPHWFDCLTPKQKLKLSVLKKKCRYKER